MNEPMTQEQWEKVFPTIKAGDRIVFRDVDAPEGTEYEGVVWVKRTTRLVAAGWELYRSTVSTDVNVVAVKHTFTPNQYMVVGRSPSASALAIYDGVWSWCGSQVGGPENEQVANHIASGQWVVLHEGVTS